MQLHPTESGRSASTTLTASLKEHLVAGLLCQREREVREGLADGSGWNTFEPGRRS